jgi:hypothetical protein
MMPAVPICCRDVIFSSARRTRIFDRVNGENRVEAVCRTNALQWSECVSHSRLPAVDQKSHQAAATCAATALFLASSLAIALNVAPGSSDTSWIPTTIALLGGLFLLRQRHSAVSRV